MRLLYVPVLGALASTSQRDLIVAEAERWSRIKNTGTTGSKAVLENFRAAREYRNLFYYRLREGNRAGRLWQRVLRPVYRGESTLHLGVDHIGPGLFIQHGFATIALGDRIGANCWLNQQVTVGFTTRLNSPVIGDNVKIHAGAIVVGSVNVGDGAVIAAGAVVVKDVPAGMVARGNPASNHPIGRNALTQD